MVIHLTNRYSQLFQFHLGFICNNISYTKKVVSLAKQVNWGAYVCIRGFPAVPDEPLPTLETRDA
jgi:hypothetical protein